MTDEDRRMLAYYRARQLQAIRADRPDVAEAWSSCVRLVQCRLKLVREWEELGEVSTDGDRPGTGPTDDAGPPGDG